MKKFLQISLIAMVMLLSSAVAFAQKVVINGNNVCIRSAPEINSYNKIGHANKGATFAYIGTYGSFYCINYRGQYGYVHKSYSYMANSGGSSSSAKAVQKFAHVTGNNVRVRSAASLNASIVGSCNKGDYFVFLGYQGAFAKVKYGGYTRYIHRDYVYVK